MKHEYRITLPVGTYTYARNGLELDRIIADCMTLGVAPNQLGVTVVPLPNKESGNV